MECLNKVRESHGNDCMIVHSYKQPDSYFIIVAVENTRVNTGAELVSSIVGKTVLQASPMMGNIGQTSAAAVKDSEKKPVEINEREHQTAAISSSILGLARELGALSEEAKDPTANSIDVSQKEFEALSFNEVLNEVVSQSGSKENTIQSEFSKTRSRSNEQKVHSDAFVDMSEIQTSDLKVPLSDSAMLFSSILSQCIKVDSPENFAGT
jgi:flagellar biosynthesis GTPase FlhF